MSQPPDGGAGGGRGTGRRPNAPISSSEFAGLGIQFVVAILLFTYLGHWLDGRLGSDPWLTVAGAFLGAAAGFYSLVRHARIPPRGGRGGESGGAKGG